MTRGAPAKKKIGILGGMGPEATVLLMARIIRRTATQDDADHVPMLVDNNPQVPSRIKALIEATGDDPAPVLARMARNLEAAGARALAMPCNTAHHYASAITDAVDIPFLNMVELTADRLATVRPSIRRAGLLASPAVEITGLYEKALSRRGIEGAYAPDRDVMLAAIRALKLDGADPGAARSLSEAAQALIAAGSQVLVIACSEFSLVSESLERAFPCTDSLNVLADAVIDFAGAEAAQAKGQAAE